MIVRRLEENLEYFIEMQIALLRSAHIGTHEAKKRDNPPRLVVCVSLQ